ncbi:MAG: hypothetical protein ACRDNW_16260, partial [Trebonia sp.]
RELSAARGALVDALTAHALTTCGVPDPPPSLRLEVSETLAAALADPEVAAAFAAGTLTRAAQWSGFGVPPAQETGARPGRLATGARGSDDHDGYRGDGGKLDGRSPTRGRGSTRTVPVTNGTAPARSSNRTAQAELRRAEQAERRQADEEQRLAREAAERATRRRERQEDAERVVAAASRTAADAVSAEDRLEAEVRDLERRLTQARADLATARMRARHAEAAEHRARQALNRLSDG